MIICEQFLENSEIKIDDYVLYIVDLVWVIVYNMGERMLLIVENNGVIVNFDLIVMVEVLCIVGLNGFELIIVGIIL